MASDDFFQPGESDAHFTRKAFLKKIKNYLHVYKIIPGVPRLCTDVANCT